MSGALTKSRNDGVRTWFGGDTFNSFRKEMDDVFSRFGLQPDNWPSLEHVPALDLSETEADIDVKLDVPGFKPEDIDIQVRGNLLTISGKKQEAKKEDGREYHRVERHQGSFTRSVTLPCDVVSSKAKADYQSGVLTLTLPKTNPVHTEKITVNAAS